MLIAGGFSPRCATCNAPDKAVAFAGDTLIDDDGTIDEAAYQNLLWFLDRARERPLFVDISFSAETVGACADSNDPNVLATCLAPDADAAQSEKERVSTLEFDEFKGRAIQQADGSWDERGIVGFVHRLVRREDSVGARIHGNVVVIDIQNESTCNHTGPQYRRLSDDQVGQILRAIRDVAPPWPGTAPGEPRFRLTTSYACGFTENPADAGDRAELTPGPPPNQNRAPQDAVTIHTAPPGTLNSDWSSFTDDWVTAIRTESAKPIYISEHMRWQPNSMAGQNDGREWINQTVLFNAMCEAKKNRVLAYTFHTGAGMHMNQWTDSSGNRHGGFFGRHNPPPPIPPDANPTEPAVIRQRAIFRAAARDLSDGELAFLGLRRNPDGTLVETEDPTDGFKVKLPLECRPPHP